MYKNLKYKSLFVLLLACSLSEAAPFRFSEMEMKNLSEGISPKEIKEKLKSLEEEKNNIHKKTFFNPRTAQGVDLLIEKHGAIFSLYTIEEDGEKNLLLENQKIEKIDEKEIISCFPLNKEHLLFTYGELNKNSLVYMGPEYKNDSDKEEYKNKEYRFFDISKKEFFKIENEDFSSVEPYGPFHDDENFDSTNILFIENLCKQNSNLNQTRYSYYNLETRKPGEVVLDFRSVPPNIAWSIDKNRRYHYHYMATIDGTDNVVYLVDNQEIPLKFKQDPVYTFSKEITLPSDSNYVIAHPKKFNGLYEVEVINLKTGEIRNLKELDKKLYDNLRSHVYKANVEEGVLTFNLHYDQRDKKKFILEEDHNPSDKIKFKTDLKKAIDDNVESSNIIETLTPTLEQIVNQNGYSTNLLTPKFKEYFLNELLKTKAIKNSCTATGYMQLIKTKGGIGMPTYFYDRDVSLLKPDVADEGYCVIHVHGGPHARSFNQKNEYASYFNRLGYTYVETNIRGTVGFGNSLKNLVNGNFGYCFEDIECVTDHCIKQGKGKKFIVMGGSFGGFVAANVFKNLKEESPIVMCVSTNGFFDLNKDLQAHPSSYWQNLFGETEEKRRSNSATDNLQAISSKKHLILIAGDADKNCKPEQSYDFYNQNKDLGNNVSLYAFKGQPHCFDYDSSNAEVLILGKHFGELSGHPYWDYEDVSKISETGSILVNEEAESIFKVGQKPSSESIQL
jgi:hypothetical protein